MDREMPMGLALLVCDMVIQDRQTNKRSLIGLFDRLFANQFPCVHPQLSVFISLTSGRGTYQCEVRCRNSEDGTPAFSAKGPMTMNDPMQVVEMVFNMQGVRFTEPGHYWLECLVDEVPVMMRRITVTKPEKKSKGKDG